MAQQMFDGDFGVVVHISDSIRIERVAEYASWTEDRVRQMDKPVLLHLHYACCGDEFRHGRNPQDVSGSHFHCFEPLVRCSRSRCRAGERLRFAVAEAVVGDAVAFAE